MGDIVKPFDMTHLGVISANTCPKCGFTFALFGIEFDTKGEASGLYPVEMDAAHVHIHLFCPHCGVDMKEFPHEQNIDLDKLIAWKRWAEQ